jgi:hypothetical protein
MGALPVAALLCIFCVSLRIFIGDFWCLLGHSLEKFAVRKSQYSCGFWLVFCIKKALISNQGSGWAGGNRTLILWLIHAVFRACCVTYNTGMLFVQFAINTKRLPQSIQFEI